MTESAKFLATIAATIASNGHESAANIQGTAEHYVKAAAAIISAAVEHDTKTNPPGGWGVSSHSL